MSKSRKKRMPQRVLALPDLEQAKSAVLNTLTSVSGQRTYDTWDDNGAMLANSNESVQLITTVVTAFAAVVAAVATVWYAFLTRKLWASTDANVALTKERWNGTPNLFVVYRS